MISQRAKLSNGLSRKEWGNYKRTWQGALATLLLYIYYYIVVCAITIFIWPLSLCLYLMSITHPPYIYLKATICPDVIPLISAIHVYTMCIPWGTHVLWRHLLTLTPSRLFLIHLDPKSFQTTLDSVTWLPGHLPISYLSSIVD